MDEKNVRWTEFKCDECGGYVLHDTHTNDFYCENCGLIQSNLSSDELC